MSELVVLLGDRRCAEVRPLGVLPVHIEHGVVSHVAVDSHDNTHVFQRGDPPVVVFNPAGGYLQSWGSVLIGDPHGDFNSPDDQVMLVGRCRAALYGAHGERGVARRSLLAEASPMIRTTRLEPLP